MQKRLIVVAASALSTVAFAQNNKQKPPTNNALAPDICEVCTNDVVVKGPQIQVTTVQSSASIADTDNGSTANNMLSNTNGVLLKGQSGRITALSHTGALAHANDGSYAQDKLASQHHRQRGHQRIWPVAGDGGHVRFLHGRHGQQRLASDPELSDQQRLRRLQVIRATA